ncbi:MAG: acyl-CoA synthetase [Chloroflexi bacterium]|nr:MAG: acyl-CoA synthetase [Chloroflexota bacterium]
MSLSNPYSTGLDKNPANFAPLTPLTFLTRAAQVYPHHTSIVHGVRRYAWAETYTRCRRLASALQRRGIGAGDTVAVMGYNTPETFELHYGVPMAGAVLNTINTRLDAATIAFILEHGEAKALFTDREASTIIKEALNKLGRSLFVIDIDDPLAQGGELLGGTTYDSFLAEGDPDFGWQPPADEWSPISLNYTSGTTGNPKGVVYHHRGAYLNAVNNVLAWELPKHPVYLWTLPMFHCNGWCFPWTLAAVVGTNVCLRRVDVNQIYDLFEREGVTHYCGAPTVHYMLINAPAEVRTKKKQLVKGMIAAAPPPAAVLQAMAENQFEITHVYGLTETYGPAVMCDWHTEWGDLPIEEQARLKARQGVRYHMLDGLTVADPVTMEPVPADGQTLGEVLFRGNIVMMGYLKNEKATNEAFRDGWFHSGDLGVLHPDGYIELKDRAKDIIISGGENISTIEVENVLYRHPAILEAAVVARPDEKWGETPCAFVTLRPGMETTEAEIIDFCRQNLAHFKAPKTVIFGPLPKTSTGKVQKFILREQARQI